MTDRLELKSIGYCVNGGDDSAWYRNVVHLQRNKRHGMHFAKRERKELNIFALQPDGASSW